MSGEVVWSKDTGDKNTVWQKGAVRSRSKAVSRSKSMGDTLDGKPSATMTADELRCWKDRKKAEREIQRRKEMGILQSEVTELRQQQLKWERAEKSRVNMLRELNEMRSNWQKDKQAHELATQELEATHDAELEELVKENGDKSKQIHDQQEAITQLTSRHEKLREKSKKERTEAREKLASSLKRIQALEADGQELRRKLEVAENSSTEMERAKNDQASAMKAETKTLQERVNHLEKEKEHWKQQHDTLSKSLEEDKTTARNEAMALAAQSDKALQTAEERHSKELTTLKEQLEQAKSQDLKEAMQRQAMEKDAEIQSLTSQLEDLNQRWVKREQDHVRVTDDIKVSHTRQQTSLQSMYDALKLQLEEQKKEADKENDELRIQLAALQKLVPDGESVVAEAGAADTTAKAAAAGDDTDEKSDTAAPASDTSSEKERATFTSHLPELEVGCVYMYHTKQFGWIRGCLLNKRKENSYSWEPMEKTAERFLASWPREGITLLSGTTKGVPRQAQDPEREILAGSICSYNTVEHGWLHGEVLMVNADKSCDVRPLNKRDKHVKKAWHHANVKPAVLTTEERFKACKVWNKRVGSKTDSRTEYAPDAKHVEKLEAEQRALNVPRRVVTFQPGRMGIQHSGNQVQTIYPGTQAADGGVKPGWRIVMVGGTPVGDDIPSEWLDSLLQQAKAHGAFPVTFAMCKNNQQMTVGEAKLKLMEGQHREMKLKEDLKLAEYNHLQMLEMRSQKSKSLELQLKSARDQASKIDEFYQTKINALQAKIDQQSHTLQEQRDNLRKFHGANRQFLTHDNFQRDELQKLTERKKFLDEDNARLLRTVSQLQAEIQAVMEESENIKKTQASERTGYDARIEQILKEKAEIQDELNRVKLIYQTSQLAMDSASENAVKEKEQEIQKLQMDLTGARADLKKLAKMVQKLRKDNSTLKAAITKGQKT